MKSHFTSYMGVKTGKCMEKRRCRVLTGMFYTFNYLKDRQVHGEKGGVEC